jgi:hypothetical protein
MSEPTLHETHPVTQHFLRTNKLWKYDMAFQEKLSKYLMTPLIFLALC